MFLALAGGVGGAKLAYGLSKVLEPRQLTIAVNTGDDFSHLGLAISPDLDTVCYTLAELEDQERGWGRAGETWRFMETLKSLGHPGWFQLGDCDLALHVMRTQMLAEGKSLSDVTSHVCEELGILHRVVPMSDDRVETVVHTKEGPLAFQEYFVRDQCQPVVDRFEYRGAGSACAQPGLWDLLTADTLTGVIVCPSNPWLSIGPMLAIAGIREALMQTAAPVIAVSPIIGGRAVKGPAAKLMAELGLEVSALSIARHYADFIDALVIDSSDEPLKGEIESLGVRAVVADTLMLHRRDRVRLASDLLNSEWR